MTAKKTWLRCLTPIVASLAVAVPSAVGLSYLIDEANRSAPIETQPLTGSPNLVPGTRTPKTVPAENASLRDEDPVIGVSVNGVNRAYSVAALSPMMNHVVNDLVDGQPVTVTYCDRTDCIQVFTADGDQPLDVWTGGFMGNLMLRLDGKFFWQHTGQFVDEKETSRPPLRPMTYVRTTWKKWRKAHPTGDVYAGAVAASSANN